MKECFYVMQAIDGDECLLHHRETKAAAIEAMKDEAKRDPAALLSVWSSTGGMLMLLEGGKLIDCERRRVS